LLGSRLTGSGLIIRPLAQSSKSNGLRILQDSVLVAPAVG
jgi:hypothetical protein